MGRSTEAAAKAAGDRRARLIKRAAAPVQTYGRLNEPKWSGTHAANDFFTPSDTPHSVSSSSTVLADNHALKHRQRTNRNANWSHTLNHSVSVLILVRPLNQFTVYYWLCF